MLLPYYLPTIEEDLSAIVGRSYCEMDPVGRAALFENQFIEISLRTICDIQKDYRHADHLLRPIALDIHRAAREVI